MLTTRAYSLTYVLVTYCVCDLRTTRLLTAYRREQLRADHEELMGDLERELIKVYWPAANTRSSARSSPTTLALL